MSGVYERGLGLMQAGKLAEAERVLAEGRKRRPKDFALANLLGVVLKNRRRYEAALAVLAEAEALAPAQLSPVINRGNIHLTRREGGKAAAAFERAVRAQPDNADYHLLLGRAYRLQGRAGEALERFETVRRLKPGETRAWIEAVALLEEGGRFEAARALVEAGIAAQPGARMLAEAKLALLRRGGLMAEAASYARSLTAAFPDEAWVHVQIARCVMHGDRAAANAALREAVRLEPENADALSELADSLDRTRGPDEARNIAEAYEVAKRRLALGGNLLPHARTISSIFNRACDFARAEAVGGFAELTQHWAETGFISALHYQMAQVASDADRRLLLEAHRQWGRSVDAIAARAPIAKPAVRTRRAKLRLGLMSSDLRNHPVAYFALPLIEGYDRERFELYCYSWNSGPGDAVQGKIAALCDGWRLAPAISDREAATLIAGDRLDMLIELGGTTYMNKLNVMAYRPAPVQASWLGYPHSAGPGSIDYIVVDPYNRPADDGLLIEKPMVLARSWVVLGSLGFNERIAIQEGTPEGRAGHLTFGTMNNPYKYTRAVLAAWAGVLRAVPGSRFLFVRPEGAVAAFRENVRAVFAEHGVDPARVEFEGVRGTHMPHYNRIDIALDAFPQTGGTTTCEALWMGVPTVSLVGPAFYERLSNSNLHNAGLGDLCAGDLAGFQDIAVGLAADPGRRAVLRRELRGMIRARPLGRADWFVADFQAAVFDAVVGK